MLQTSRFHESKAVGGPAGQPAFLNGACLLETDLPPRDLLGTLQAVENTLERQRDVRWGPRTIDLDLLLYDTLEIDLDDLTVPHPRMTTRRFVLEPCAEIAPDFLHPPTGCSVRDLLENISPTHRRIAVCGVPGSGALEVATTLADATIGRVIHGGHGLPQAVASRTSSRRLDTAVAIASHWYRALTTADDDDSPRTSVSDFWAGSLAAFDVWPDRGEGADDLHRLQQLVSAMPSPHVLILLRVSTEALDERVRFCQGPFAQSSDIFADLLACLHADGSDLREPAVAATPDACWVDHLLSFQTQLESLLDGHHHMPDGPPIPKAVVRINADDLGEAADEAIAAVEAMS